MKYLYVNGELDIDAIYSKQKRKKMGSYDASELEILAPENSHELDSFKDEKGSEAEGLHILRSACEVLYPCIQ